MVKLELQENLQLSCYGFQSSLLAEDISLFILQNFNVIKYFVNKQ